MGTSSRRFLAWFDYGSWESNMKQHSADGCDGGASDMSWPTLQRGARFGDDQNAVLDDASVASVGLMIF